MLKIELSLTVPLNRFNLTVLLNTDVNLFKRFNLFTKGICNCLII